MEEGVDGRGDVEGKEWTVNTKVWSETWRELCRQQDARKHTYVHICTYIHPRPPTHTHTNTHLHTVSEQAPFCRLTGSNISPEQQICVVVVVMMMVEVVRLSPLPGSPRSLPLPRRLRSESDPSNDSHRHDAHRKHPEQEKKKQACEARSLLFS